MWLVERVLAAIGGVAGGSGGGGGGHAGELIVIGWPAGDGVGDPAAPLEEEGEGCESQGEDGEE